MKKALPERAKLSKESKECVQECVSEFISFITSQAADKCKLEKRKTLNGEDILWAMYTLGFENYSETLKIYLAKYRQYEQEQALIKPPRRKMYKRKKKQKKETLEEEGTEDEYDDEFNNEGTMLNPSVDYFQENNLNQHEASYPAPPTTSSVVGSSFPIGDDFFQEQSIENTGGENFQYLNHPNIQQDQQPLLTQSYPQQQQLQLQQLHTQAQPHQMYTPQEQAYDVNDMSDIQMQLNQQGQNVGIILRSSPRYSRTGQGNNQG